MPCFTGIDKETKEKTKHHKHNISAGFHPGIDKEEEEEEMKEKTKLDDSRTSMPALARPCTSGVETSKHMQVTYWHCGCWDHYECVDNQYLSPHRTGGKWLPWFLRKSRPFIFKYRPLGPTYFNIWGKFTIVDV